MRAVGDVMVLPSGAYVARSPGEPSSLDVVPGTPLPEQDLNLAPTMNLFALGASSLLQCGFRWPLPEDEIRVGVATWFPGEVDGATCVVRSAVTDTPEVTLTVEGQEVARAMSSGYPPYVVVVSVSLDPARAAVVQRAIDGERGLVTVVYRATVAPSLILNPDALKNAATRGVVITKDRTVTATCDVADWARRPQREGHQPC